jgi:hypothetical protein
MAIVDGRPSLSFKYGSGVGFKRADDAQGSSWTGSVINISSDDPYIEVELFVNDNKPAVIYFINSTKEVKFVRSLSADGSIWSGSEEVVENSVFGGGSISATVLDGKPCCSYEGASGSSEVRFARESEWPIS